MSSKLMPCCLMLAVLCLSTPAIAQGGDPGPSAEQALATAAERLGPPPPVEDCGDANLPTTENVIVVCRRRIDQSQFRIRSDGAAEDAYAEATKFANDPQAPELFGIANHGAVAARSCFIPPCPPPLAIIIDVEALPQAPPGSDADRIARGLAPIGDGNRAQYEAELGLPPRPNARPDEQPGAQPGIRPAPDPEG